MATLEDLPHENILDMDFDDAIEQLRQLRLSRLTQKKSNVSEKTLKKRAEAKALPKLSSEQASELLKLLGGL
jgi:hypothetical protein